MGIRRLSLTFTLALVIVSCAITYFINEYIHTKINQQTNETMLAVDLDSENNSYKIDRLKGYRLIKPLIYAEQKRESGKYSGTKEKLISYIEQLKSKNKLISASVYIKDFEQGDWMSINDTETYYPGSLIKVPGMISFLKMSEKNPSLLDKKISFENISGKIPEQTFGSKQIKAGESYTIRELLKYMVSYSDNNATYLLNKNVDLKTFHQLFEDLDIPKLSKGNTTITARNFSLFLNVLFNASYLTKENSEFAVELLEACDFKMGLVKGLPVNTVIAHKFGEMGDENTRQLHESGLIYINNSPYLLTIMTKGYDIKDLPEILSTISKMVYKDFINKSLEK